MVHKNLPYGERTFKTVGIPDSLHKRIKALYWDLGHTSLAGYVAKAVMDKLATDEYKHLEILEERIKEKQRRVDLSATERTVEDS